MPAAGAAARRNASDFHTCVTFLCNHCAMWDWMQNISCHSCNQPRLGNEAQLVELQDMPPLPPGYVPPTAQAAPASAAAAYLAPQAKRLPRSARTC